MHLQFDMHENARKIQCFTQAGPQHPLTEFNKIQYTDVTEMTLNNIYHVYMTGSMFCFFIQMSIKEKKSRVIN